MVTIGSAAFLVLAPLGILAVAVSSRRSVRPLGRARRIVSFALRSAAVLLLTLALGRPVLTRIEELPRFTTFLLDVSESVPRAAAEDALRDLKPLWDREVADGQRCALIAFAASPEVWIPPTRQPLEGRAPDRRRPPGNATDLGRAVEAARALFQEGAANRVVLLTDGRTTGKPVREIDLPPSTMALRLGAPERLDVAILDVQAPAAVRAGEPFDVRVTVNVTQPADFALSVAVNDTVLPEAKGKFRAAAPGRHSVVLPNLQQKGAFQPRLHELLVIAEAAGDAEPRNNLRGAAVTVTGKPRVLLVEGSPAEGEFLARLLRLQDIDFVRRSAPDLAASPERLEEFVAVILAGVAREAMTVPTVAALQAYVENFGGGLWVVGSSGLQGPNGYAGSELEKLLPVVFLDSPAPPPPAPKQPDPTPKPPPPRAPLDPATPTPQKVLAPTVAVLLLVDKSGSMAGDNIVLVKEACLATAKALTRRDLVSVIAFDIKPRVILEFTEAERYEYIEDRILRLFAGGGTNIQPALVDALTAFQSDPRAARCAVKHCVLLSDGDTPPADFETSVLKLADAGITVSTVCVAAAKFDPGLMAQIAGWGRGRFKFTATFEEVPQLIVNDVKQAIASLPKEAPPDARGTDPPKPPTPDPPPPPPTPAAPPPPPLEAVIMTEPHEVSSGIDSKSLPGLRGRLPAASRPKTDVLLMTREKHPVLALGRRGLGKTAVWTSDLSGVWSSDWLAWKDSGKLFAQLARYVSSAGPDAELAGRIRISAEPEGTLLRVDGSGPGGPLTVSDSEGPLRLAPDEAGSSVTSLPSKGAGKLQRIHFQRSDGKTLTLGALTPYDREFAPPEASRDLFAGMLEPLTWTELERKLDVARMSGERRFDLAPWLIVAVLLLLPLDVALRRYSA